LKELKLMAKSCKDMDFVNQLIHLVILYIE
jgi:hypothetical protein